MVNGPIGALGAKGGNCPHCLCEHLKYDSESDVTSCPSCGWNNCEKAEANHKKRLENGDVLKPWSPPEGVRG